MHKSCFESGGDTIQQGEIMNTRCTLTSRAAAFLIALAALFIAPAAGRAQAVDCNRCDQFTISVNPGMHCAVTICYAVDPAGAIVCATVRPGRSITIPCPVYRLWVNTCTGPYYIIPAAADVLCSPILSFASDCCGRVCVVPSPDLCTRLEIQPTPCVSDQCP